MPESENQKHKVIFLPSGRRGEVDAGKNLKEASVVLGVDIEGVCGEKATCGKCKVRIEEGFFEKYQIDSKRSNLSPLTEAETKFISPHEAKEGYRLACQAWLHGDVMVFVPEESRVKKQVVRKAAREIPWLVANPAVKKYYVELKKATLEDTLGDFERIQAELTKQYGLKDLTLDYQVLLTEQKMVRDGDWKVTVSLWMDKEIVLIEPGHVEKSYGIAIDIGTTTVVGYLCEMTSGQVIATESMMNPQVIYGEDVMSRITYNMTHKDGAEIMRREIVKGLNEICGRAAAQAGIKRRDIVDMTVVGNTCMHHLFMALDTRYIGMAPFTPALHRSVDIKARDLGLKVAPGAYVHILPIEAGFVGADNVGVLLTERPYDQDAMELVIDIGTNGELVLGNRHKLISSSCATGPAFEGAEIKFGCRAAPGAIEKIKIDPETKEVRFKVIDREEWNTECEDSLAANGICGSGIIDVVPQLFMAGIIDKTGRFNKDVQHPRLRQTDGEPEFVIAWANETSIGQDIVVCQSDVRNIQLAKGAMYSGAKLMMRHLGIDKLDKVILAGAFGSYINKESAAVLGMFPDCDLENVYSVGNAAGDGARIALLNVDKRKEADRIAREVEYMELTLAPDFDKVFAQAMWIPHMKDKFSNLEHLLPEKK
jgi:uncharacterized 2Fe-2S/4Fe-4S cluster protein (DUF4445 family)